MELVAHEWRGATLIDKHVLIMLLGAVRGASYKADELRRAGASARKVCYFDHLASELALRFTECLATWPDDEPPLEMEIDRYGS